MIITVVGTGYVGLVSGACFAEAGNTVLCLDRDPAKISILQEGGCPIYEPGLLELIRRNVDAGRLRFTINVEEAVQYGALQFIAVGTPPDEDGSADLQYVLEAARNIGRNITDYRVIINKSTVPVGTGDKVRAAVSDELKRRGLDLPFSVVSNPEFLKEGAALENCLRPDRIVLGIENGDDRAESLMRSVYAPFELNRDCFVVTDIKSAELIKYAANAMLATRISFMNELANLAERLGADIEMVRRGIGCDPRIGNQYLHAGCGYGGSCLPKDVKALIKTAREDAGLPLPLLTAVEAVNNAQKHVLIQKIKTHFGDLAGKHFALWGLAFKPDTDDMRAAPSCDLLADLFAAGASVCAYDPAAIAESQRILGGTPHLNYVDNPLQALADAEALIIVTEWQEFRSPDFDGIKSRLKMPVIFDGRNLWEPQAMRERGFEYFSIGRR
ncbi:MAG: UDP-glucose/GDP-mannose dehydrogenase family protein [Proteobacteria bacterium]|nr:UDP-glucose/GDP-mannose dehydrogenase family protein [Pseudomonadota bacterium]